VAAALNALVALVVVVQHRAWRRGRRTPRLSA
jgi:hypothetical protein